MITLSGEPQSTNHIYKSHCRFGFPTVYMSKEGKAIKESYQWEAKSQWKQKPLQIPLEIEVKLYFKTQRKHDIDNYGKILLDSLTGIVWEDDNQVQMITISKGIDKVKPRIEITVL